MNTIDTGDTVIHKPTGETWVVACVIDDRLFWAGWPPGYANLADCELTKKSTASERDELLQLMADLPESDTRCIYARKKMETS